MNSSANLIRRDLQSFQAYSSARREAGLTEVMLNANERAWPNRLYPDLYRYPEQQPQRILKALSTYYQVNKTQLLVSRGSDEGIELLIRLFCMPGDESMMICPPTFGMYAICAKLQAVQCIEVPLLADQNFAVDVEGLMKAWTPKSKLIFLCSPNNPTGNLIDAKTIDELCRKFKGKAMIVVDEAYIEFATADSLSQAINLYDNLVVLRTLSKAFGLAGARCGVTLSSCFIIKRLQSVMAPYPIPSMLIDIVERNMTTEMQNNLQNILKETRKQRQMLCEALEKLNYIQSTQSTEANFILIKINNSEKLMNHCQSNGILLRDMSKKHGLKNVIRISVGNREDNQRLINCMREYNE